MALQPIGGSGFAFIPDAVVEAVLLSIVLDAAGESATFIGPIALSSGPGSSKVLSSAGGKIYWVPTAVTFVNASTTIRIGVQDVNLTTGIEDGTFDVHDDLIGGTDTITADTPNTLVLSTGTKTIAHGDIVAISIEMTARGGVDTVRVRTIDRDGGNRYVTNDVGAGPVRLTTASPYILIEFDDGTFGSFGEGTAPQIDNNLAFSSSSTPDEIALIFTCPFKARVSQLLMYLGELDTGEDGEIILYSDPLGTPTVIEAITIDPDVFGQQAGTMGYSSFFLSTPRDLTAGAVYAVAYRPTTTGSRTLRRITLPTGGARHTFPLGVNFQQGQRTDQTGAFGSLSETVIPMLGIKFSHLDDGVQSGGSGAALGGVKVVHPGHILVQ